MIQIQSKSQFTKAAAIIFVRAIRAMRERAGEGRGPRPDRRSRLQRPARSRCHVASCPATPFQSVRTKGSPTLKRIEAEARA
jgi:hypothetical protein